MTSTVRSLAPAHPIIEVTHAGPVSASDVRSVARQVADLMQQTGIDRVLADWTDATSGPDNIAIMAFGDAMDREHLPTQFRHALVWSTDPGTRLSIDMMSTVENLHHHQAETFGDRDSAIAWLSA